MSTDNFENVFNDFLLSILNEQNTNLVSELRHRFKQYLNTPIVEASKTPVKEPLFVTNDNVPIYEGDDLWVVDIYSDWMVQRVKCNKYDGTNKTYKYFSTEQAASNWILENKPMFSISEIKAASNHKQNGFYWYGEAKLIHLAHQKQSQ